MPAIRIELSKDLHKRLRIMTLRKDTTLQKLVPLLLEAQLAQSAQGVKRVSKTAKT